MGMLVTLYLISSNVYNSVQAPPGRGFSYIETWMIGTQFPILIGLLEYGVILAWKRLHQHSEDNIQTTKIDAMPSSNVLKKSKATTEDKIKMLDVATFCLSATFFFFFNIFYWPLAIL